MNIRSSQIFKNILRNIGTLQQISWASGKEPEFVGIGKHSTLRASRDDIQIS
jgi:hypothetical protein